MKFRVEHIIILVLLIWLVITQFFTIKPEPNTEPWKIALRERETKIEELSLKATEEAARRKSDSLQFIESKKGYDSKVENLNRSIAKLKANPKVVEIRANNPTVDSLIVAQDSVIAVQQEQLFVQGKYISQLQTDLTLIKANFNERLTLTEQNYQDLSKIADAYQKENKKLKRRNRFKAALIPAALVAGFLLGSQL